MSASFHMAQRTGVILSGDYSGDYSGTNMPESGKYGITSDGSVWHNGRVYNTHWEPPKWNVERSTNDTIMERLTQKNVASRSSFEAAVEVAKKLRAKKSETGAQGDEQSRLEGIAKEKGGFLEMLNGTYTDGSYTYVVKSNVEAYVEETGKTFTPDTESWVKFTTDLNAANKAGKLTRGKATAKPKASSGGGGSSYTPSYAPAAVTPPASSTATPFYKAKWFLPAVAGGTVLLVLAIALWPKKKKDSAPVVYLPAPAPVPVPAPVAPTLPAPQVI
jgi:hypothetical protein